MPGKPKVLVRAAEWPADLPAAQRLLEHYFGALRGDPRVPQTIRNKDRTAELQSLAQTGVRCTLIARTAADATGCVVVHMLPSRPGAAEIKRLYVEPQARGLGAGRALIRAAEAWARANGAHELILDTLPEAMPEAVRLYRAMGFQPMERYNGNEGCCFAFFRLPLVG